MLGFEASLADRRSRIAKQPIELETIIMNAITKRRTSALALALIAAAGLSLAGGLASAPSALAGGKGSKTTSSPPKPAPKAPSGGMVQGAFSQTLNSIGTALTTMARKN